jgi:hypothetical protein
MGTLSNAAEDSFLEIKSDGSLGRSTCASVEDSFLEATNLVIPGIIPKIGKEIEQKLLLRLRREPLLSKYLRKKGRRIYQRRTIL